jgi:hypothetical protein
VRRDRATSLSGVEELLMAVTRERFNQGLTYQGFKDFMTRNREQLEILKKVPVS